MKYTVLWLPGGKRDESPITTPNSRYVPGFTFVPLSVIVGILAFPTGFLPSSVAHLADCKAGKEEVIAVTVYVTSPEMGPYQGWWIWTLRACASPGCVSPTISNSTIRPSIYYRVSREPVSRVSLILALGFWTWWGEWLLLLRYVLRNAAPVTLKSLINQINDKIVKENIKKNPNSPNISYIITRFREDKEKKEKHIQI